MNHVDEIKRFYSTPPQSEVPMDDFLAEIRGRQNSMGPLARIEDAGLTAYTAPHSEETPGLSPGCRACKAGTWLCVIVGYRCDAHCPTCPQVTSVERKEEPGRFSGLRADDLHAYAELFGGGGGPAPRDGHAREEALAPLNGPAARNGPDSGSRAPETLVTGVAYTGGEPFLYLDAIVKSASEITRRAPGIFQWSYTNGIAATANSMKRLADAGVKELRFNLLASGFSEEVTAKLPVAAKIFKRVSVEIPSVTESRAFLLDRGGLDKICQAGVSQLNMAELYILTPRAIAEYGGLTLYTYNSFFYGPVRSPIESRRFTCEVMEAAISKNLPIVVNDCSNDTKHLQILKKSLNPFLRQVKLG